MLILLGYMIYFGEISVIECGACMRFLSVGGTLQTNWFVEI